MTKNTLESPWWYRQVPRDFMSSPDVQIMTAEECGSYFFLLQNAWLGGADCTLPNDPDRLAKLARVEKLSELVLGKFSVDKEGRLYNPRLLDEWKEAVKRSKDGKKAIQSRWEKNVRPNNDRNTTVSPSKNDSNTTNTNTNTNIKERSATAPALPSPSFKGQHLSVTQKQDSILGEAFPWVDRGAEYRKIDSWLEANPARRPKKASGFLHNWFNRLKPAENSSSQAAPQVDTCKILRAPRKAQ